jgi:hypothetical protein
MNWRLTGYRDRLFFPGDLGKSGGSYCLNMTLIEIIWNFYPPITLSNYGGYMCSGWKLMMER